jgi:tetratricopeptide (TPR) repeat protein
MPEGRAGDAVREALDQARALRDDPAAALVHAIRAVDAARTTGPPELLVRSLLASSAILNDVNDHEGALPLLQEALKLARGLSAASLSQQVDAQAPVLPPPAVEASVEAPQLLIDVLNTLGNLFGDLDLFERSLECYGEAEAVARQLGDGRRLRMVRANAACKYLNEGERLRRQGQDERARELLGRMVDLGAVLAAESDAAGEATPALIVRLNRASALVELGQYASGLAEFSQLVPLARAAGLRGALVHVALYQVRALRALGALDEARGVGAQGLGQSDAADARAVAELHGELTLLEEQAGNLAAALAHHRRFHALMQKALSEAALRRSAVAAVQLQTERACERMRVSVQQRDWTSLHLDSAVTISIGLCPLEAAADIRRIVALADQALYRAKRTGRNRVCSQREPAGAAPAAAAARDGADERVVASTAGSPGDPCRHPA